MRLFVDYTNYYDDVFDDVERVTIKKIGKKNHLYIYYNCKKECDIIPLNEIKLTFMIDLNTMKEYFRYAK